jgi:hypothetical protein
MLQKTFKYIGAFIFVGVVSYNFSAFRHYAYEKLWVNKTSQQYEEIYHLYITSDNALVAISDKIRFEFKEYSHIPVSNNTTLSALEIKLLYAYTQLLTLMATDNYKNNQNIRTLLFGTCVSHCEYNRHLSGYLSKPYMELVVDDKYKNKIRLVTADDIKLYRKGGIYAIVLYDIVINMALEMDRVLNSLERKNLDIRPEKNFLKAICNKN